MLPEANANAGGAAAAQAQAADPYRNFQFRVDVLGITQASFAECSGLGVKVDALSYREAGNNQVVRRIPGQVQYADITLRYGLTDSHDMWDWLMTAVKGTVERKSVSIILLGSDGTTEVMRWNLDKAWVSEWHGVPFDALGHGIAIESMTLVFDTLERA